MKKHYAKEKNKLETSPMKLELSMRNYAVYVKYYFDNFNQRDEKIKSLEEENQSVHNKILKKNTILEQELTNKDIMFIKLNNLQNENDRLMKIVIV